MKALINPYINFKGNAREAIEFYQSIFGGKLEINTYQEFNMASTSEDNDKVMHSMLTMENGMVLMASDTPDSMPYDVGNNVSVSLSGDEAEIRGYWEKLTQEATIIMPFEKAPWGDHFGMVTDKFGVIWMVNANS